MQQQHTIQSALVIAQPHRTRELCDWTTLNLKSMTKREAGKPPPKSKMKWGLRSLGLFLYLGWIILPNVHLRRTDVREQRERAVGMGQAPEQEHETKEVRLQGNARGVGGSASATKAEESHRGCGNGMRWYLEFWVG